MDSGGKFLSRISAIALCSNVPSSAYLLEELGMFSHSLTDAGQLITREAEEPPTIAECFAIFLYPFFFRTVSVTDYFLSATLFMIYFL